LSRPDEEKNFGLSDVFRQRASFADVYSFNLLAAFWKVDFSDDALAKLILETPIEDIQLLADLAVYVPDDASLKNKVKLFDNSTACYSKRKGKTFFRIFLLIFQALCQN